MHLQTFTMTTILPILLVSLTILTDSFAAQINYTQKATLFDSRDFSKGSHIFTTYVGNLATKNFDDVAQSACITGVWLFYDNANYNQNGNAAMQYKFGKDNNCFEFLLKNRISSVRHVGSQTDYRSDTLTIYEKAYFQGEEEYTTSSLPNVHLSDRHQSLIITGPSSWTLYSMPNYKGSAICINPPHAVDYEPTFLHDLEENVGIPHNNIKSIKKGCDKSIVFGTEKSTPMKFDFAEGGQKV